MYFLKHGTAFSIESENLCRATTTVTAIYNIFLSMMDNCMCFNRNIMSILRTKDKN